MEYFFTDRALKDIKKLPRQVQLRIIKKLDYFTGQRDPLQFSETLINSALGAQRFRIGDFRVIFDVENENLIILRIGHRKSIYR